MKHANKTQEDFVFETKYWEVYLNPDQYYLGRSVVVIKRGVGDMAELNNEEWLDFAKLVKKYEFVLINAFNATMFNWSCLMNNAYQNNPPNPHVHWHIRPRYSKSVTFEKIKFEDKEFGYHYARGTDKLIPKETFKKIVSKIQSYL